VSRGQKLERDLAPRALVQGEVDFAHPARALTRRKFERASLPRLHRVPRALRAELGARG
jgi:hypothetical protein